MKPVCLPLLLVLLCVAVPAAAMEPVHASFTSNQTEGSAPLTVSFMDTSTGGPTSWTWDFDDGTTSTEQNPLYIFSSEGVYNVTLSAERAELHSADSETLHIHVASQVSADFSVTPGSGLAPLAVQFTDHSSGSPINWTWAFGDGTTSQLQNPSHVYTATGSYSVTLMASTLYRSGTLMKVSYIHVLGPVIANFTGNPLSVPVNRPVQFTDFSTGGPTAWFWNFGDGQTSALQNPVHTFTDAGVYSVTLTASHAYSSDAITALGYIVSVRVGQVPTGAGPPTDTNADGLCDDVNGNGRADFNDVVLYFNQMTWIAGAEPIAFFDYNGNGRIDFADIVWLLGHL